MSQQGDIRWWEEAVEEQEPIVAPELTPAERVSDSWTDFALWLGLGVFAFWFILWAVPHFA